MPHLVALEAIADCLAEGIVVVDATGRVRTSNPEARRLLGAAVLGASDGGGASGVLAEDGRALPAHDTPWAITLRTAQPVDRVTLGAPQPNGATHWMRVSTRPVTALDGELEAVVITLEDLADQRALQAVRLERESMRESAADQSQRIAAIVSAVNEAIIVMDSSGTMSFFNPAAQTMLGYEPREVLGQHVSMLMPEPHRSRHDQYVAAYEAGGPARIIGIGRRVAALHKGGEVIPIRLSVSAFDLAEGRRYVGVFTDLRREAALEARLRQTQKMEALGTLAGGVAHDFNNLLHGARLALDSARTSPDEADPHLHKVDRFLDRGAGLVKQLLRFARGETQREQVGLREALDQAIHLLQPSTPRAVRLRVTNDAGDAEVGLSAGQVQQIVTNLVLNAGQAMGAAGGPVSITAQVTRLSTPNPPLAAGDHAELVVQDAGPGVPEDDRSRLFEPFFTTKAPGEGTGLGLAVVHGLVERAGGIIAYEQPAEGGARFRILLPLLTATAPAHSPSPAATRPLEGVSVLLVDDEEMLASMSARLVRRLGGAVTVCTDAREALTALSQSTLSVDIVVTDLNMPGVSGLELAALVSERHPGLPVVLMSGFLPADVTLPASIRGTLDKPFGPREFASVVGGALGGTRGRS